MLAEPVEIIKTDEELYQSALEEWLGVLSRLWIAFDKPLDPERLTIYREALDVLPLGLLDLAVKRVIREHKFNSVPTIADVWSAVRKELHNPPDLERAIHAWRESLWDRSVMIINAECTP